MLDVVYKQLEVPEHWCSVNSHSFYQHTFFRLFLWAETEPFLLLFALCLPIFHLCSMFLLLAIHHLSLLPASLLSPSLHLPLSLSICLSICPSAGVAREVEQCEKAGSVSQTAGGTSAGHWGSQPAPKVRFIWCGATHLQGAFPHQRAVQVEQISAFFL